jgi:methylthioribose-1-phosphate isomerase
LATAGWGTALGVIKEAVASGKDIFVYADETRPRLQGAKLTAWELMQAGIPSKLISDSVAATLIRDGKIDCVILGADRIAANGDVCNKIGTFMLSVICKTYGVPFYSAAPVSTIDFDMSSGDQIPIEQRDPSEVTHIQGQAIAPEGMDVYNPAFDVTPHQNVTGIITEAGIIREPYREQIAKLKERYGQ